MSFILSHKRQVITFVVSVVLSVFLVAFMAGAITYIDADSVGIATSTPGAALSVKGQAIVEGFVSADYFTSTSTNASWVFGNLGLGTTTPGARIAAKGGALVEDFVYMSYFTATSTTATSTTRFGINIASTSLNVDGVSGRVTIGSGTSTPDADVANTASVDPALSIFGAGSANNATGTLYVGNIAGAGGGQIILRSTDGSGCASITWTRGSTDIGGVAPAGLTVEVVACPK